MVSRLGDASAGVPANHPDHSGRGRRIMDSARESVDLTAPIDSQSNEKSRGAGLLARLRSVMAA